MNGGGGLTIKLNGFNRSSKQLYLFDLAGVEGECEGDDSSNKGNEEGLKIPTSENLNRDHLSINANSPQSAQ